MRIICVLALAIVLQPDVSASDAFSTLNGDIISNRAILRVTPVRHHDYWGEHWLNGSQAPDYLQDRGKDAKIRNHDQDMKRYSWEWILSSSGAQTADLSDLVIQNEDHAVFEEIELNVPSSMVSAYRDRKEEIKGSGIKPEVPGSNISEYKALEGNCQTLVAGRYVRSRDITTSVMIYSELQSTHAYVLLARFKTLDDKVCWAVFRVQCSPGRIQTDLVRAYDDELIKGHTSYKIIPYFTADGKSYHDRRTINLDTIELLPTCTVDEAVKK